jgi:hypothetical protein
MPLMTARERAAWDETLSVLRAANAALP